MKLRLLDSNLPPWCSTRSSNSPVFDAGKKSRPWPLFGLTVSPSLPKVVVPPAAATQLPSGLQCASQSWAPGGTVWRPRLSPTETARSAGTTMRVLLQTASMPLGVHHAQSSLSLSKFGCEFILHGTRVIKCVVSLRSHRHRSDTPAKSRGSARRDSRPSLCSHVHQPQSQQTYGQTTAAAADTHKRRHAHTPPLERHGSHQSEASAPGPFRNG